MKSFVIWQKNYSLKFRFINCCVFKQSLHQILCLYDSVDAIDVDKAVEYIKGLQQEDGSFAGDKWGEQDRLGFIFLFVLEPLEFLEFLLCTYS